MAYNNSTPTQQYATAIRDNLNKVEKELYPLLNGGFDNWKVITDGRPESAVKIATHMLACSQALRACASEVDLFLKLYEKKVIEGSQGICNW